MAGHVGRAVEGHVPRKRSGTPRMPFLLTTAQNVMSLARAENGTTAVRSDVHTEYTHRSMVATVTMMAGGRGKGGGVTPLLDRNRNRHPDKELSEIAHDSS